MKLFGMFVGRPTDADLDAILAGNRDRAVTYDHIGSTLAPNGDGRPRFHSEHIDVGRGEGDFERAALGLRQWAAHRHIGARVHPADAPLELDSDLVVVLPVGPFSALAPDRVVMVVDEPDHVAFSYGTLPGHPEVGEETFDLRLMPEGVVQFTISVDAKPGNPIMWIGAPVAKLMQRRALKGYLAGIAEYVADRP